MALPLGKWLLSGNFTLTPVGENETKCWKYCLRRGYKLHKKASQ
jgi:hypothetical protein